MEKLQNIKNNEIIANESAYRSIVKGMKRNFIHFLQNTTLHGLKYVVEDLITIPERVFFGLTFVIVFIASGFFISHIYNKWASAPLIIVSNPKLIPLTAIPFPAITICNLNQAKKSRASKIDKNSVNYTLLLSLCNDNSAEFNETSQTGLWKYFKAILLDVSHPCNEMLLYCSYGSHVENCDHIFNTMLTDNGLCCTFNALDLKFLLRNYSEDTLLLPTEDTGSVSIDWTPEKGFKGNIPKTSPRVSGGVGRRMGLTVVLNVSSQEYYCSKTDSIGFKILVHSPADLPKISDYGYVIPAGWAARIPIEPIYQDSHESVRSIKQSVRHCLFSDEGDLLYYQTYSRKNCELECEALLLLERCSCVLYYLPRNDPTVRICGPKDDQCTDSVLSEIESSNKSTCSTCLPGCFELNYRATVNISPLIGGTFMSSIEYPSYVYSNRDDIKDLAIVHVYTTFGQFRGTTKTQIFGFTEFVSNIGGLLSLLMGFSIFSIIEIIFYITIRPYCFARTIKKQQREQRQLQQAQQPDIDQGDKIITIAQNPMQPQWATRRKSIYSGNKKLYKRNLKNFLQNSNFPSNRYYNMPRVYNIPTYPYID